MSRRFEELAWRDTPMGVISLRRRREPTLGVDVFEVKLGDEYLMSSAFTVAEIELAHLGLAAASGPRLDVVVGGLGLGETARAALDDPRVASLVVVEALAEVIDWHGRGLLPGADALVGDPRTRMRCADFFALAAADADAAADAALGPVDVVLLDVDHSPRHVLHPDHAAFYTVEGLRRLARHLRPGGVFALWSDDPPDVGFGAALDAVFATSRAEVVAFANPITGGRSSATVYVATVAADGDRLTSSASGARAPGPA